MIRPRYFPDSIVVHLVSVFAFSHSLDPKETMRTVSETISLLISKKAFHEAQKVVQNAMPLQ